MPRPAPVLSESSDDEAPIDVSTPEGALQDLQATRERVFSTVTDMLDRIRASPSPATIAKLYASQVPSLFSRFFDIQTCISTANLKVPSKIRVDTKAAQASFDNLICDLMAYAEPPATPKPEPTHPSTSLNLPSLDLPTFDGELEAWGDFRQSFDESVHLNGSLSNLRKLQYLRTVLKGEALLLIKEFTLSEGNYLVAYQAVCTFYEDTTRAASYFYKKLRKSTFLDSRALYFAQLSAVTSLKALGLPDLGDFLLFNLAFEGLSPSVRKSYELALPPNQLPTWSGLMNFLKTTILPKESMVDTPLKRDPKPSKASASRSPPQKPFETSFHVSDRPSSPCSARPSSPHSSHSDHHACCHLTSTTPAQSQIFSRGRILFCYFCESSDHRIVNCGAYLKLSPSRRLSWVQRGMRCVRCLSRSHSLGHCLVPLTCQDCGNRRHHTTLHRAFSNRESPSHPKSSSHSISPARDNQRRHVSPAPRRDLSPHAQRSGQSPRHSRARRAASYSPPPTSCSRPQPADRSPPAREPQTSSRRRSPSPRATGNVTSKN